MICDKDLDDTNPDSLGLNLLRGVFEVWVSWKITFPLRHWKSKDTKIIVTIDVQHYVITRKMFTGYTTLYVQIKAESRITNKQW